MRKEIQEWIEKGNRTEAVRLLEEWVGKHPADEEECCSWENCCMPTGK